MSIDGQCDTPNDLIVLTHFQVGPPRGGEVSHRGTGIFCWMY